MESHQRLAMQPAREATVLGDFGHTQYAGAGASSVLFRDDGRFMVRTAGSEGTRHDYQIKYTFGVLPLQQYLIELPGGRLQAFSIA